MQQNNQIKGLLWVLMALTAVIIIAQFAVVLPQLSVLSDLAVGTDLLQQQQFHFPWVALPGILFCLSANIGSWLLLAFAIYFSIRRLRLSYNFGITCWLVAVIGIFSANQWFYPLSAFSELTSSLLPLLLAKMFTVLSLGFVGLVLLAALLKFAWQQKIITASVMVGVCALMVFNKQSPMQNQYNGSQPNIIIIGLDSLRPDYLSFYGGKHLKTPNLDQWLQSATRFNNAYSPLARTYPAWLSILTGNYPIHNGVRNNLSPLKSTNLNSTLPKILHANGYQTVYATDDKRFNNIDKSFGFDTTLGPKIGVNDFLIGKFNDFPLANLIVNTPLGKWLYPYNYANRAAFITYQPKTFTGELTNFINKPRTKPLFFAVHFCMSHWPYTWASVQSSGVPKSVAQTQQYYANSVAELDKQFAQFSASLQKSKVLNNAVVLVISDHGEALGWDGERLLKPKKYVNAQLANSKITNDLDQTLSHGSDVFNPSQYKVLFAMQTFGINKNLSQDLAFPISLVDVMPTLLNYTKAKPVITDGISLKAYIHSDNTPPPPPRPIYTETGFTPNTLNYSLSSTKKLLAIGMTYFTINHKTGRIETSAPASKQIIRDKQRALLYDHWLLGVLPQSLHKWVLVDMRSGKWTDQEGSSLVRNSPFKKMHNDLLKFYGQELTG